MQQDLSWDHAAEQYENILVAGEAEQSLLCKTPSLGRLCYLCSCQGWRQAAS